MRPENTHFVRYLESLKSSPFFSDISCDSLKTLLTKMIPQHWERNTIKNSAEASSFYVIVSGRLKVYKINRKTGRAHTLFIFKKGDIFDVLSLMHKESRDIYWEAIDDMDVLKIDVGTMREWIFEQPTMIKTVIRYMSNIILRLEEVASDISLRSTVVRLSGLLIQYINCENHKLETIHNLQNDEIACLIGTTRAVANRHIQQLKKCGAISVSRNRINIQNLPLLTSIAKENYVL